MFVIAFMMPQPVIGRGVSYHIVSIVTKRLSINQIMPCFRLQIKTQEGVTELKEVEILECPFFNNKILHHIGIVYTCKNGENLCGLRPL